MRKRVIWKMVPGFRWYEVSNTGLVRSLRQVYKAGHYVERILMLLPSQNREEAKHVRVTLYRNFVPHRIYVHRAVLMAFSRMPKKGEVSRHMDGDATNNDIRNLRWGTVLENIRDRERHGTAVRGELAGRAKLTEKDVRDIRKRYIPRVVSTPKLGKEYGVHSSTIGYVIKRKSWTHI